MVILLENIPYDREPINEIPTTKDTYGTGIYTAKSTVENCRSRGAQLLSAKYWSYELNIFPNTGSHYHSNAFSGQKNQVLHISKDNSLLGRRQHIVSGRYKVTFEYLTVLNNECISNMETLQLYCESYFTLKMSYNNSDMPN